MDTQFEARNGKELYNMSAFFIFLLFRSRIGGFSDVENRWSVWIRIRVFFGIFLKLLYFEMVVFGECDLKLLFIGVYES